jgi:tetratricopeptide (TPR) repeat protein
MGRRLRLLIHTFLKESEGKRISIQMKRLLLVLTISFFMIVGCGVGVSDYDDAVLDGVSALNLNKPEKAFDKFSRAVKLDPKRADGYLGRADSLNALKRYEQALEDYDIAIKIDPKFAKAYVNRAVAYSHLKNYQKAIVDYEKGLELDPEIDDPPGFFKRLFSNDPNTDKGIRKHLEFLKQKVKASDQKS